MTWLQDNFVAYCDSEKCNRVAVVEWFIIWTDRHTAYNLWRACRMHRGVLGSRLREGSLSGGVVPKEMLERDLV